MRTSPAIASQRQTRERIAVSAAEHYVMLDAIMAGDGGTLCEIIRAHILQTRD